MSASRSTWRVSQMYGVTFWRMMSNPDASAPTGSIMPVPRAIVAGHGDFAAGLISAVQQITGRGDQLVGVAVQKLSVTDIEALLREKMMAAGVSVIFTDLQAGSC